MSITQVAPQAPTAQGSPAPSASPSDPTAASRAASATKPDADGDFDGSKTANEDAVKVTLSDSAIKRLAADNKGG